MATERKRIVIEQPEYDRQVSVEDHNETVTVVYSRLSGNGGCVIFNLTRAEWDAIVEAMK